MKNSSIFEKIKRIAEKRTHCSKVKLKIKKMSSYMGGNPSKFFFNIFLLSCVILFNSVCFE